MRKHLFTTFILWGNALLVALPRIVNAEDPAASTKPGLLRGRVDAVAGTSGVGLAKPALPELIGKLVNAGLSLVGTIFLALIVYGGYRWMTAQGDEEDITKAKGIIRQAIIGLIVVMAAGAISYFITARLEKV